MPKVYLEDKPKDVDPVPYEEMVEVNRYKKFAQEYMRTGNGAEAAFLVYNCKDRDSAKALASKLRKNPKVVEFMREAALETGITPSYIQGGIKDLAENARNENVRLKAYEMLGKILGMFDEGKKTNNLNLFLNDEEARKILGADTKGIARESARS